MLALDSATSPEDERSRMKSTIPTMASTGACAHHFSPRRPVGRSRHLAGKSRFGTRDRIR